MKSSSLDHEINDSPSRYPRCQFCNAPTTLDQAPAPLKNNSQPGHYRRRRTYVCNEVADHRFFTDEAVSFGRPMLVRKSNGAVEAFDFSRLLDAVRLASTPKQTSGELDKWARKVTEAAYDAAGSLPNVRGKIVNSYEIGKCVLDTLKDENEIAMWIRFSLIFYHLTDEGRSMKTVLDTLRKNWDAAT